MHTMITRPRGMQTLHVYDLWGEGRGGSVRGVGGRVG